jgi:serine/threonine protein kinase
VQDGYKLVERIGKGNFGEVWRAEAPGGVPAAVKIIYRPVASQEADRELQSLELIKRLQHPYLLQTQAFWLVDDQLHIAMELAEGSLRDRARECEKGGKVGIPLDELLRYFREAAEALDYLHGERVLHRDVKPENILLLKRHAKVADFGLARLLQDNRQSVSASSAGTPRYMAPEMWRNKVSPFSDQYSLAMSYAELRLGRQLFESNNMMDVMLFHTVETPKLFPLGDAEQAVLLRAMAKETNQRYPTCSDFVAELEKAARSTPDPVAARLNSLVQAGSPSSDSAGTCVPSFASPPVSSGQATSTSGSPTEIHVAQDWRPADERSATQVIGASPWRRFRWTAGSTLLLLVAGGIMWHFIPTGPPSSNQNGGGGSHFPPSFALKVDDLKLMAGEEKAVTIRLDRDHFQDAVKLAVSQLPRGLRLKDGFIPDGADSVSLAVGASRKAHAGNYEVKIHASGGGREGDVSLPVVITPYLPAQCRADAAAEIVKDADNDTYYNRIDYLLPDGTPVPFVLIPRQKTGDPPTFYIMENKVSGHLFREFAAAAPAHGTSPEWQKGARADGKDMGIANEQLPALRVTVADAHHFARWLGGALPTPLQWDKAAGRYHDNPGEGPFRGPWKETDKNAVAVNRAKEGPLPVGTATADVSPFGCHDMAGNGREWTRQLEGQGTIPLAQPSEQTRVILRGRSYMATSPLQYEELEDNRNLVSSQYYLIPSHHTGFRVVIELNSQN